MNSHEGDKLHGDQEWENMHKKHTERTREAQIWWSGDRALW